MKTTHSECRSQNAKRGPFSYGALFAFSLSSAFCVLSCGRLLAAEVPARLFFSDAKISFTLPEDWTLSPSFPYGPLFTQTLPDGSTATISCAISAPLDPDHVSADVPTGVLRELAQRDLTSRVPGFKSIVDTDLSLGGHNAYAISWEELKDGQVVQHRSAYFYVENRLYAVALEAQRPHFAALVGFFDDWLSSLDILSRRDSGSLTLPAQGGVWVHQTGGLRISIPSAWLIGVADDRSVGATYAEGNAHTELTATLDSSSPGGKPLTRREKKMARILVKKKGHRILKESEVAFHNLPAFQIQYEGMRGDQWVDGTDLYVSGPKARWLFNIEGDVSLYHALKEPYQKILDHIEFL